MNAVAGKSQCLEIHIFLCGKNGKEPFIQHRVDKPPHLIRDQFLQGRCILRFADSKRLAFLTDHKNVGIQNLRQDFADIIKDNLSRRIVVQ
jgi:hypothetical protein